MDLLVPDIGLIIFLILSLLTLLLWVWAIRSIIVNEFQGDNEKLIWALLVIFVPVIGTVMYYLIGIKRIKN